MKVSCDIIRDLLPLYAEELVSEDSKKLVDEHLCECDPCTKQLGNLMKAAQIPVDIDVQSLKKVKKTINLRQLLTVILALLLVPLILFGSFAVLTRPIYMSLEQSGIQIIEEGDELYFDFAEDVDAFTLVGTEFAGGEEAMTISVTAYRRLWDRHYGNMLLGDANSVGGISPIHFKNTIQRICYSGSAAGEENTVLWGAELTDAPVIWPDNWMPDLWYWALIIGVAGLLLSRVLPWQKGRKALEAAAVFFLSYGVWELLIAGGQWKLLPNSDMPIYLCFVICLTFLSWACTLIILKLRRMEK